MTNNDDKRGHGTRMPPVRDAHDASDDARLQSNPANRDAQLDVAVDETFPASDPPSVTQPGGNDPAPSSGFDPEAERKLAGSQ